MDQAIDNGEVDEKDVSKDFTYCVNLVDQLKKAAEAAVENL